MRKQSSIKHIHDRNDKKTQYSYQTRHEVRQDEQLATKNPHLFKREDLGFTNRDTRGYDKFNKGRY